MLGYVTLPSSTRSADFTYCSTWSGIVYVSFVVDVFSRRIVGWKASRTMHTSLVLDALNMAAWIRRGVDIDGVVCHSDAGSQIHLDHLHRPTGRDRRGAVDRQRRGQLRLRGSCARWSGPGRITVVAAAGGLTLVLIDLVSLR